MHMEFKLIQLEWTRVLSVLTKIIKDINTAFKSYQLEVTIVMVDPKHSKTGRNSSRYDLNKL